MLSTCKPRSWPWRFPTCSSNLKTFCSSSLHRCLASSSCVDFSIIFFARAAAFMSAFEISVWSCWSLFFSIETSRSVAFSFPWEFSMSCWSCCALAFSVLKFCSNSFNLLLTLSNSLSRWFMVSCFAASCFSSCRTRVLRLSISFSNFCTAGFGISFWLCEIFKLNEV